MEHVTADKLVRDLRTVVGDAEDLLEATAHQTGERIEKVRARATESLQSARQRLTEAGKAATAQARDAAREVNHQVHEHPWIAVGVAAGVGLLFWILLGRK